MTPTPDDGSYQVPTPWGTLTASCNHPDVVRFAAGNPADNDGGLVIHHVTYMCHLYLYRTTTADTGSHPNAADGGQESAPSWDMARAAHFALQRPGTTVRHGTPAADRVLRDQIVPYLQAWLDSPAAAGLLAQGEATRRADEVWLTTTTEQLLTGIVTRVRDLRRHVDKGGNLDPNHELFLRDLHTKIHP